MPGRKPDRSNRSGPGSMKQPEGRGTTHPRGKSGMGAMRQSTDDADLERDMREGGGTGQSGARR